MQSVELLLDEAMDAHVRGQWQALAAAGLPSQAQHTGHTNAPHITLAVREAVDAGREALLREVATRLPVPVRLGGAAVFGRHRYVLARLVVPDAVLLDLHAAVWSALGGADDGDPLTRPGSWTPHVTLGRGYSAAQVGQALETLGGSTPVPGVAVDCRRWDSEERRAWSVRD